MVTTIYMVRHAEPNYNNHDDLRRELTEKGLTDRLLVTDFLLDKKIDAVYSSPYHRAKDTIKPFADKQVLTIHTIDDLRERKVDSIWIEDFTAFTQKQWSDFSYKLSDGESLQEVQERNLRALTSLIDKHHNQNIAIGSHGTALSTLINYFQPDFTYQGFNSIKHLMPFIAKFTFEEQICQSIIIYNLFKKGDAHETPIL